MYTLEAYTYCSIMAYTVVTTLETLPGFLIPIIIFPFD